MPQVAQRSHAMVCNLIDVQGELCLNVLMFALRITNRVTVPGTQLGELEGDREIGRFGMANRVAYVMRKSANGESQFVCVMRIAEQVDHKVTRSHIVREVREGAVTERIITDVLNYATTIGIGACAIEFGRC